MNDDLTRYDRRDLVVGLVALGVVVGLGAGIALLAVSGFRALVSTVAHG